MTWTGTLAGAVAALLVPAAGAAAAGAFDLRLLLAVAAGGMIGNLADSVAGLRLQGRLGRLGNDWTNLIATAVGAVAAVALGPAT